MGNYSSTPSNISISIPKDDLKIQNEEIVNSEHPKLKEVHPLFKTLCPDDNTNYNCRRLQELLSTASFCYEKYREDNDALGTSKLYSRFHIFQLCDTNEVSFVNKKDLEFSFDKKCDSYRKCKNDKKCDSYRKYENDEKCDSYEKYKNDEIYYW